jgi:hypothetical protein
MRVITIILLGTIFLAGCGSIETEQPILGANPEKGKETSQETEQAKTTILNVELNLEVLQIEGKTSFNFSLKNEEAKEIDLYLSSGQQYEIIVSNERNEVVYRYSDGKMFTMALLEKKLGAGETFVWSEEWDQKVEGVQVPNGEYIVTVEILANSSENTELSETSIGKSITIDNSVIENEGSVTDERKKPGVNETKYENNAFRNIEVTGESGFYIITGEARVYEAVYRYAVTDGHIYFIDDFETVSEGGPSWSKFSLEITLAKKQLPVNGTITLELFEDSAKDGSRANELMIPLETFGQ